MRLLPLLLVVGTAAALGQSAVRPVQLRCEYRVNPLGIDTVQPRLSWILAASQPAARGLKQSAYQILVSSSEAALGEGKADLWDSGMVRSEESAHVVYAGQALRSGAQAFWKVRVWDQDGKASAWSEVAFWSMGLLDPSDWTAKWIGRDEPKLYRNPASAYWNLTQAHWIWFPGGNPAKAAAPGPRFFRRTIEVPSGRRIKKALCIIGADARYELYWNGQRHGRSGRVGMPEVYDMTSQISPGRLTLAVRANNSGKDRPAGLIAAVRVDFDSGDPLLITTSSSWKTSNQEAAGWEQPGFDDAKWVTAQDLGPYGMEPWGEVGFSEERALPARMLRKEFDVPKKVRRATVYLSGLGLSELYVNGGKVGDAVLSPGLTDYRKHVFYVTYDVTRELRAGRNAIGLLLGNGRFWAPRGVVPVAMVSFGYPKARLQLEIEYEDGSTARIVTDESWKLTCEGPIRANNEFDGEEYDARREMPGWSRAGFDDSKWEAAQLVSGPDGRLVAQMSEPIRVTQTLRPVKVNRLRPGVYVFDMGQNMVGWCRLRVSGPKGAVVTLRHAETLKPDGSLYVDNLRSARATDTYVLKGQGVEVWEPRFTYHGFRFVEVTGYPGVPTLAALEGRVVHDDMTRIADFQSSNELLNKIHRNILWGVRGNYRSIPTDCPQRDERQGWLGDRSMVSRSESYLHDVASFYAKWMQDIEDSQRDTGSVPVVAPAYWVFYHDDVTWPSTFLFVPGMLYEQYGDRRVLERHYPAMRKWIEYMQRYIQDGLVPRDQYGDWCVPPESPQLIHSKDPARRTNGTLIGTAYYYFLLKQMARYARILGRPQDAPGYEELAERMRAAFEQKFYVRDKGIYDNGTQTSAVLPLAFGITPEANRKAVFDALIRKIEDESKGHIGVGLVGAQWLMRTLSDYGRPDVAYQIATQKTYPGWGYMIEKGATTIWELWNGDTADPAMNSGNHVMQIGDLGIWLYSYLGGIRPDPENPGYRHAIIRPVVTGDLRFVKVSHRSMYGLITSHWIRNGSALELRVTVPPNASATVYVPARDAEKVTESGAPAAKSRGVRFIRAESGAAVFEVSSGNYIFRSEM